MIKKVTKWALVFLMCAACTISAYAGNWVKDWNRDNAPGPKPPAEVSNWWYQEDDGTYPASEWKQIDGKWYYFNEEGWLLQNTAAPDGAKVDKEGARIPFFVNVYPTEVIYTSIPPRFTYNYKNGARFTGQSQITMIMEGLEAMNLEPVPDDTDISTTGMVSILNLVGKDGTSQEVRFAGSYLITENKKYKMNLGDGNALNAVLYRAYADKLLADGCESTPAGTISRTKNGQGDLNLEFLINCQYQITENTATTISYQVKRGDAPILDTAGGEWQALQEGAQVSVIYSGTENGALLAKAILIVDHGKSE